MWCASVFDWPAPSAPAHSAASNGAWSRFGRIALTLALIAGGSAASIGQAAAQPKPPAAGQKAAPKPAAAETPAPTPSPAVAAPVTPEKISNTAPAWTVGCFSSTRAAAADCKIEQRLFVKETGRALSVALVEIPGATRQPLLLLQLPNGLALQDGVSLSIDGNAATPLLWQSCDGNGCYATLVLTPALIETMKAGKVMAVKATAANREPLTFQHLLTDFASAYEAAK